MDSVIYLVKAKPVQDARGVLVDEETKRRVFCKVDSVTRQEFFQGGRAGLNPAYVITMFGADYEAEDIVEYEGFRYYVYRTYKREEGAYDYIELYVERKGGINAGYSGGDQQDPCAVHG